MKIVKNLILPIAIAAVTIWLISHFAAESGRSMAEQHIERLEQLWPNFMQLPDMDRGRLAMASRECHLESQPVERTAIERCLSEGAQRIREKDYLAAERVMELLNSQRSTKTR